MTLSKSDLRTKIRKQRQDFVKQHNVFEIDLAKSDVTFLLGRIARASCVAGYLPLGSETDVTNLMQYARTSGVSTALPHIPGRDGQILFRQWAPGDAIEAAAFGFRQPLAESPECVPDIILTPLVAFDRACNRLGQGKGHYDRAFAAHASALRIGVAWSVQEVQALPADPWDVPLDAILTEREWIVAPGGRLKGSTDE
jgi:5-formyltetrahydrofolate cyclo-ligase